MLKTKRIIPFKSADKRKSDISRLYYFGKLEDNKNENVKTIFA